MVHWPCPDNSILQLVARMATIGEWMPRPRRAISHGLHEDRQPFTILNGGAVDDDEQHAAQRVGDDMALAARNLLARVMATNATVFGGFDRLAVDHTGTGRRLFTGPRSTRRWLPEDDRKTAQNQGAQS